MDAAADARFWAKVNKTDTCWLWTATLSVGYGSFHYHGKMVKAHQYAWRTLRGPIPEGMELDHLCRTKACCNPDHLEPVTHQENVRRAAPTVCREGHPFEMYGGIRQCRICARRRLNEYQQVRRRAAGAVPGGPGAAHLARTECRYGHPYNEENTGYKKGGSRFCRECTHQQRQARQERIRRAKRLSDDAAVGPVGK